MNNCCESNVIFLGKREYSSELNGTDIHRLWICTKCDDFTVTINGSPVESLHNQVDDNQYFIYYSGNRYQWGINIDTDLEYQLNARKTVLGSMPEHIPPIAYFGLGLSDEAGEVAGKIKKLYRDSQGIITPELRQAIKLELGDVLWYLTNICTEFQLPLSDVMDANIAKLFDRQERGMIQGNGDNR